MQKKTLPLSAFTAMMHQAIFDNNRRRFKRLMTRMLRQCGVAGPAVQKTKLRCDKWCKVQNRLL
jgi:hypothetical protein